MARLIIEFREFDANNAQCYRPSDKQKLLSVIERGFGSIDEFNMRVRRMLSTQVKKTDTAAAAEKALGLL